VGIVKAICISEKRGTAKIPVEEARFLADWGMEGDAHAGNWHRQVSLLSFEAVEAFRREGADVAEGAFGENLLVSGFDFPSLPIGTQFRIGEVLLEITQIGKECHDHCAIFYQVGHCIMPEKGVFARVLQGGMVHVGDRMDIV